MKPQDKAIELYNKFCYAIGTDRTDSGYYTNIIYAKQCTLIAIDEMIIQNGELYLNSIDETYYRKTNSFLFQVKQIIEKL